MAVFKRAIPYGARCREGQAHESAVTALACGYAQCCCAIQESHLCVCLAHNSATSTSSVVGECASRAREYFSIVKVDAATTVRHLRIRYCGILDQKSRRRTADYKAAFARVDAGSAGAVASIKSFDNTSVVTPFFL